jgi:hypothetical protein
MNRAYKWTRHHSLNLKLMLVFSTICLLWSTGCDQEQFRFIRKISVEMSDNLESITLMMDFAPRVQFNLPGEFPVGKWGSVFLNAPTSQNPFQVGFRLNTSIFRDNDILHLQPISTFPNGVQFPRTIETALVQISGATPINDQIDIYGYVDIARQRWLGIAVMLKFVDQTFPAGLAFSQEFFPNTQGKPAAVASVFGPKVQNSRVTIPGGFALMGDISRLLEVASKATFQKSSSNNTIRFSSQDSSFHWQTIP